MVRLCWRRSAFRAWTPLQQAVTDSVPNSYVCGSLLWVLSLPPPGGTIVAGTKGRRSLVGLSCFHPMRQNASRPVV